MVTGHEGRDEAPRDETICHELGVATAGAEADGRAPWPVITLLERMPHCELDAALDDERVFDGGRVEAAISPRESAIIDGVVGDSEVVEGDEPAAANGLVQPDLPSDVVVAEREHVVAVLALGCRGEAEQEPAARACDDGAIGRGVCVVELVDDDVVPRRRGEVRTRERLDGGEDHRGVRGVSGRPVEQRRGATRKDELEGALRLAKVLEAMRDEEDGLGPSLRRVEGGEEGLADARGGDDDRAFFSSQSELPQAFEGLSLGLVRCGEWRGCHRRGWAIAPLGLGERADQVALFWRRGRRWAR